MQWTPVDNGSKIFTVNQKVVGRVRPSGERWVAYAHDAKSARTVGWFNTELEATQAFERDYMSAVQIGSGDPLSVRI